MANAASPDDAPRYLSLQSDGPGIEPKISYNLHRYEQLWETRAMCASAVFEKKHRGYEAAIGNRVLTELGLATGIRASLGHTSMRVPRDPDKFVVKGRGYRVDVLSRMRPEDMVVCDLEGNWLDGPPYSTQCFEVAIHSCIYRARPDVVSVTHVHPDYAVLMSIFQKPLVPMAQEGIGVVSRPLAIFPQTKVIVTQEEGEAVADMLADGSAILLQGHGAITVSTQSVEGSVMAMAHLEHQSRLNFLAMSAGGMDHPRIPDDLASAVLAGGEEPPHLKSRREQIPGGRNGSGLWNYFAEVVTDSL